MCWCFSIQDAKSVTVLLSDGSVDFDVAAEQKKGWFFVWVVKAVNNNLSDAVLPVSSVFDFNDVVVGNYVNPS